MREIPFSADAVNANVPIGIQSNAPISSETEKSRQDHLGLALKPKPAAMI